jgi:glutamate synthase domain-containing protein 2/glutamate synthase domain-containing protein 3
MAFDQIEELCEEGAFDTSDFLEATERYFQAINKGLLKIMSKMGISTISSYCGAQTFEAVGVSKELIDRCFTGTPSSIGGIGLEEIAEQAVNLHREAYPEPVVGALADLGLYRYNRKGEHHGFNPTMRKVLHQAVRSGEWKDYRAYAAEVHGGPQAALRDLLEPIARPEPGAIEEVEPAEAIMRRFNTAAMSLGALSPEAHETLAVAMNRIGGRSNSGEGGEDPLRHGTERNSAIKQVASGRFGVTPAYLLSGDQLEIKIAQGAKPGEGGQLPGFKVSEYIARLRHAQVGTTLISPPPHHDIYSIEDLAQLIFDLKHVHPAAKVSVKLVAESGVGTIAAGCAKAGADIIHIAGHEGGTGASPLSSIKHAGSPWEMGLAETQQALVVNQLRERVTLRADGGLKTGRDVIIAALLGADEFGFGTIAVIAEGCVMARQCHMNNCPVGVATQRDDLRKKFPGTADHVVRFFQFVAEEIREHLAALGATSLNDVIGHPELLRVRMPADEPRAAKISLAAMLAVPAGDHPRHCTRARNDRKAETVDAEMIERSMPALERGEPVEFEMRVRNTHLTIGGRLASEVTKRHGEHTLAPGTITARLHGTAGQSFGAFCVEGIRLLLTGEANDYVGKGLTGGELVIRAAEDAAFDASRSVLAGNTILYGATCGSLFIGGRVGERFAVRNSGAESVVEGVGDHGCEYMTGGHVAILGPIGRNFAAGFTGGLVHILCEQDDLEAHINRALVTVGALEDPEEIGTLRNLIERHRSFTGSAKAARLLEDWDGAVKQFVRIVPKDAEREVEPRPRLKPEKRSKTSTRA